VKDWSTQRVKKTQAGHASEEPAVSLTIRGDSES
jgi:hypothetical protein